MSEKVQGSGYSTGYTSEDGRFVEPGSLADRRPGVGLKIEYEMGGHVPQSVREAVDRMMAGHIENPKDGDLPSIDTLTEKELIAMEEEDGVGLEYP